MGQRPVVAPRAVPEGPKPSRAGSDADRAGKQERRRFPRARVAGTAIALGDGQYVGSYLVRNLSAGGAYLVGDNNLAVGQAVQLLIRVGEHLQSIDAEVVRRERLPSGERSFAVAFRNLSAEVEDSLQHLALLAIDGATARKGATVLLLGSPSLTLFDLGNDVRSLGYEAEAVATPLDAISLLSSGVHHIAAAVVVCDYAADPLGFLSFVKDAYPQVHRVALPGVSPPAQFRRAVASGVVETVLGEPWGIDSLSKALRPSGSC
jgi:hypothetical protein